MRSKADETFVIVETLICLLQMMHFVRAFSIYACLRRKAYRYGGGSKL